MSRLLTACLVAVGCASTFAAEHTKDSLETVKKRVTDEKAVLVDVRELAEWKRGHLEQAKFIPLSRIATKDGLAEIVKTLPKDKPIYLHCKSGGRCVAASEFLELHGLDVRPLKAGYADLLKAGFEKAEE